MEVKLNPNVDSIGRVAAGQTKRNEAKVEAQAAAFESSEALEQSLRRLPDSRTDAVAKAKQATALSTYPPPETIKKIAALLSKNITE
jgi:hypothetical protein